MLQKVRFAAMLSVLFVSSVVAPSTAHAWPLGRLFHLHPAARVGDGRITVQLYNKSGRVQQVRLAGTLYTLMPHGGLAITAQQGTKVYAASTGLGHREGDLLFVVTPALNGETVSLN